MNKITEAIKEDLRKKCPNNHCDFEKERYGNCRCDKIAMKNERYCRSQTLKMSELKYWSVSTLENFKRLIDESISNR